MDGIEKLSRLSLVACDQSYDALVAKGVSKLAPYLDSGAGDIAPNTMPASFYDPVYVGLNDWTVFDRIDDAQTGFGATIYTRVANDKTDFMVALQGTRGPSAQDWNGNLGFGLDKWNSAGGGQLLNRVFSDLLRGTNDIVVPGFETVV